MHSLSVKATNHGEDGRVREDRQTGWQGLKESVRVRIMLLASNFSHTCIFCDTYAAFNNKLPSLTTTATACHPKASV